MFLGGRERVHWERMGEAESCLKPIFKPVVLLTF